MTRSLVALALASISFVAVAAPPITEPVEVTVANPVLAVEVSPSSRFQHNISFSSWQAGSDGNSYHSLDGQFFGIPTGKLLVLEHVSANVGVNPGEKAGLALTCQGADVLPGQIYVGLKSAGVFSGYERLIANEPMRCYAGPSMFITFVRNSTVAIPDTVATRTLITLVGFLIDAPQ